MERGARSSEETALERTIGDALASKATTTVEEPLAPPAEAASAGAVPSEEAEARKSEDALQ